MNISRSLRSLFLICILCCQFPSIAQHPTPPSGSWQVCFSPRGGATAAIVQTLDNAKSNILVQAYSFTSYPIAEALIRAHERGVRVLVILDKSQRTQKYSMFDLLSRASIPTLIDEAHAIAHNKVMIIDDQTVITGSFNFTQAAEARNAENLLIIHSKELASRYIDNWRLHQAHSKPKR